MNISFALLLSSYIAGEKAIEILKMQITVNLGGKNKKVKKEKRKLEMSPTKKKIYIYIYLGPPICLVLRWAAANKQSFRGSPNIGSPLLEWYLLRRPIILFLWWWCHMFDVWWHPQVLLGIPRQAQIKLWIIVPKPNHSLGFIVRSKETKVLNKLLVLWF